MTDRVKKDFEKWLITEDSDFYLAGIFPENFWNLSPSMQWGVWVDYYDSVLISINVYRISKKWVQYDVIDFTYNDFNVNEQGSFESFSEARKSALEKASEIRDKQL